MNQKYDVAVIGGGHNGLTRALEFYFGKSDSRR